MHTKIKGWWIVEGDVKLVKLNIPNDLISKYEFRTSVELERKERTTCGSGQENGKEK